MVESNVVHTVPSSALKDCLKYAMNRVIGMSVSAIAVTEEDFQIVSVSENIDVGANSLKMADHIEHDQLNLFNPIKTIKN